MFIYYFITLVWCEWCIGKVIKLKKMQFKIYALIHIFQSHSVGRFGSLMLDIPELGHTKLTQLPLWIPYNSHRATFTTANMAHQRSALIRRRHFVATFVFLMHSWQCCQLTSTLSHHTHNTQTCTHTHVFVTLVLYICNQTGTKYAKHFWCLVCLKASSASCGCFSFPLLTVSSQRRAISPTVLNRQAPKKRERKKKGESEKLRLPLGRRWKKERDIAKKNQGVHFFFLIFLPECLSLNAFFSLLWLYSPPPTTNEQFTLTTMVHNIKLEQKGAVDILCRFCQ